MSIKAPEVTRFAVLSRISIALFLIISGSFYAGYYGPNVKGDAASNVRAAKSSADPKSAVGNNSLLPAGANVRPRIDGSYGKLPLSFEVNRGQANDNVRFLARGSGYALFLAANEAILSLSGKTDKVDAIRSPDGFAKGNLIPGSLSEQFPSITLQSAAVRFRFLQASVHAQGVGLEPRSGKSNYFTGNDPKRWRRNILQYSRVRFLDLYPGINIVYYGRGRELEFDLEVAAGSDPEKILLQCEGAESVRLNLEGDLVLRLSRQEILLRKPRAYQREGSERKEIDVAYRIRRDKKIQFQLAAYDISKPLTIDPVLSYASYLGGSVGESASAVTVDSSGNAYIVGYTNSSDFPVTSGAYQFIRKSGSDIFISKLNPAGNALVFSTFLGGNAADYATAVAIDASGNVYVTGYTYSNDFPTTSGAPQRALKGNCNIFIAKLDRLGSQLTYSTYLGGAGYDNGRGLAVDSSGNAIVVGESSSADYPTQNAIQANRNGYQDVVITKLNSSGTAWNFSTYFGGSSYDYAGGIAVDPGDNLYVTGYTYSDDFSTTSGAFQRALNGLTDAFVVKFPPSGKPALYSTYLGGSGVEYGYGIAVDLQQNVLITGQTSSSNLPVTQQAYQKVAGFSGLISARDDKYSYFNPFLNIEVQQNWQDRENDAMGLNGSSDAFAAKLNSSGTGLIYSTYLGGTEGEAGYAIAVDSTGNAVVTGVTVSPDFPSVQPFQSTLASTYGVYKTGNAAGNWTLNRSGLPVRNIQSLAIDPTNSNIAYVGVGRKGVYKTTNGGSSWNPSNTVIENSSPTAIIISPASPNSIYIAGPDGVWRSVNSGASWSSINPTYMWVSCLTLDPKTPSTVHAAGTGTVGSTTKEVVTKSIDGGISWASPVAVGVGFSTYGPSSIAVDPSNSSVVYVANTGGPYKSNNGGSTWIASNAGIPSTPSNLVVDPQNPTTLYLISNSSVYRTTNGGSNWSSLYCCLTSLVIDPSNSKVLYGADNSNRRVMKSTDGGSTWAAAWAGAEKASILSLAISASNPAVLMAGLIATSDAFLTQLSPAGSILFSSYLGGEQEDRAWSIATNNSGTYVAGDTYSDRFATASAFQSTKISRQTAFIAKVSSGGVAPGKATLISPAGAVSTATPTYTWNAVASASYYLLFVNDPKTQGKVNQWYKAADAGCGSGTGTCTATPSTALTSGACQWWVQTWNEYGTGPWSDPMSFTVAGQPAKTTLISPSGTITTSSPAYVWNAVSSSSWYLLWVNDSKTQGKINQWYKAADAGCGSGSGTCTATLSTALASGAGQWWVQTYNDYGYGAWSDPMSFSVLASPAKATLVSPSGNITNSRPTYTWNAVSGSSYYLLFVNDSKAQGTINQWYKAADAGCAGGTGACSATPATALAGGSCQWWIQTWNDSGYGPWSDAMAFVVGSGPPGKATLISPSGTIATTTPTYAWNAVPGSTWYLLWVTDSASSGKINKWHTAAQAGCSAGTGGCSVTPETVLANGASQWWIQTYNDSGAGPWSDGMSFTVGGGIIGPYSIKFAAVPAGEFQMGSNAGLSDEKPVHRVVIGKPFQLGVNEITQGQWKAAMGNNPSANSGDDNLPVEQVSWSDVQAFLATLNAQHDGYTYRLPTEAEWEYACRAGTTGDYAGSVDEMAWYAVNSGNKTHPVGTKKANAWGLYDMHGNVVEWVQDWYSDQYYGTSPLTDPQGPASGTGRVIRGGGWSDQATSLRSSYRDYSSAGGLGSNRGFRLVRTQ